MHVRDVLGSRTSGPTPSAPAPCGGAGIAGQTELERGSCALCRCQAGSRAYHFDPYGVIQCSRCGCYFLSPRPTEEAMVELYSRDYFETGGYDDYSRQETALSATFRSLMANLRKIGVRGGRLLEVGCGYGYLLREAGDMFDLRVGTDFSAQALKAAAPHADRLYRGGIEAVPPQEHFDCIVTTHVIEHVYRPLDFVVQLSRRLRPGGALMLATPDMGSFWRRILGHRWPSFKVPEHLHYFDRSTLARLMEKAGLQKVAPIAYPHAFPLSLVGNKLGLTMPSALGRLKVWLPATTVACYGLARQ